MYRSISGQCAGSGKCLGDGNSLRGTGSGCAVWLAQCFCEAVEALADCKLVESAKAEEQRIRIRASESASIDGENLNALGGRSLFCAS